MNNKWIILGIIAVTLIILIILIVGVTVSRRRPPTPEKLKVYADPKVFNLRCQDAVGSWESDHTVAVFKVSSTQSRRKTDLFLQMLCRCDRATVLKQNCKDTLKW